ncbi:unnamed protein product [Phytophthora fragariaefolia]|uniref:Unnamed protein product n=1 Tax=Phytophthora fragariaefolia TaxID=1490495 RepID=A0A9W6Y847_9STRA|nr:unnamed protein product [Phytophthora fragariaefolia]
MFTAELITLRFKSLSTAFYLYNESLSAVSDTKENNRSRTVRSPTPRKGRTRPTWPCYSSRHIQPFSGEPHWDAGIKVVRYLLKTKDVGIVYGGSLGTELEAYSDADWAGNRYDRRSVSGMMLMMCGAPVVWRSTFQKTVALSSTEAECMTLSECVKECIWMRRLLKDMSVDQVGATVIYEDNQGAMTLAKNVGYQARTKHIDIRYHFIREKMARNEVELVYVDTWSSRTN